MKKSQLRQIIREELNSTSPNNNITSKQHIWDEYLVAKVKGLSTAGAKKLNIQLKSEDVTARNHKKEGDNIYTPNTKVFKQHLDEVINNPESVPYATAFNIQLYLTDFNYELFRVIPQVTQIK